MLLELSQSDLMQHTVIFGIDVYPPIMVKSDRTHLNMFYEDACREWPKLFDAVEASGTEFKISGTFKNDAGAASKVLTFELDPARGPRFRFPLLLPAVGDTDLSGSFENLFQRVQTRFFSHLSNRQRLRVGIVRELVLATGDSSCSPLLGAANAFSGADLQGGKILFVYGDAKFNHRITIEPGTFTKTVHLPAGTHVTHKTVNALVASLDVITAETRAQTDADIEELIERASSLWPDELMGYLNERCQS